MTKKLNHKRKEPKFEKVVTNEFGINLGQLITSILFGSAFIIFMFQEGNFYDGLFAGFILFLITLVIICYIFGRKVYWRKIK